MAEKPESAFNRDHVIPQAFGLFEGNFVLTCVCAECNKFFGDTVELKLARDSLEAHDRVLVGLTDATEYKALGRRSTTYVEFGTDSPAPGAAGYLVAPKEGDKLGVTLKPRVGFALKLGGPFHWWPLTGLPTKEDLEAKGFRRGEVIYMQTQGEASTEEFGAALTAKGFSFSFESESLPPNRPAQIEIVFNLARPEFQALTKIALNYVAAVVGPEVARRAVFDDVRRFARYDEGRNPVTPPPRMAREPARCHYVSVQNVDGAVVAHVSLLMRNRYYTIVLTSEGFVGGISSAHFFNLDTREVVETLPLPIQWSAGWGRAGPR
jgi:hypothetical protein